ncbi:MAG: ABC transporter ATP-binding protein [Chloroflexota bacterium]|nr:ABC transporter ATP-binding protein [Chloroflexota bacterium]
MIEARNLTRQFGTFIAVSQLSLHVPNGTILALLGPNGAGKTTTVRMLSGLLAPTKGEASVAGYDIYREPDAVRACIGLVTDVPGLYEQMEVAAYLEHFGCIYGIPAPECSRRIDVLLKLFELDMHRNEKMVGFSKGMKQKVALARALIHEPSVLFLDEPTSGLDPLAARTVRELIVQLKHSSRSIILCTHDLDEAERLADQVAIMRQGRIVVCDTPAALRRQATSETLIRIEFVGDCPLTLDMLEAIPGVHTPHFSDGAHSETQQASSLDGEGQLKTLEYFAAQPQIANPQVLTSLVMAGAQVVSVVCETRSLEDVYATVMSGIDVGNDSNRQQADDDMPLNEATGALLI